MSILQRYVMRRIVSTLAITVVGVLLVAWIVQALQRVNLITDGGTAIGGFLWIALLLLPRILTVILPFALVLAVTNAFTAMNSDSETVVVHATGAGRKVFIVPVVTVAVAVTAIHLATVHLVEPASRQAFREAISDSRAALLSSFLREGQFQSFGDNLTVHIDGRAPGGELRGMLLSDRRDPDADRTYYARTALLAEREGVEFLLMRNGQLHSRDIESGEIQIVEFATYALDLSNLSSSGSDDPVLYPKDRATADLLRPDPGDPLFREQPGDFRAELHKRLSSWLYIWTFGIIAVHAAARPLSTRETTSSTMTFVLTLCLAVRGAGFLLEDLAASKPAFIPALYALPLGTGLVYALLIARNRRFLLPDAFRRARNRIWDGVAARLRARRERQGATP